MSFQQLLTKTVTIQSRDSGQSPMGGGIDTWSASQTVKGRLVQHGGNENSGDDRASIGTRNLILSKVDTSGAAVTLTHDQRVVIDSVVYDVKADAFDAGGQGHHLEVPVEVAT